MLKNKKIILITLIFVIFLGVSFLDFPVTLIPATELSLSYKNTSPYTTTVYDFMDKLRKEEKINFTEKNYVGMGKFIVSINEIKGNGDKNWIYYVNNKKAETGVSNYKIKEGDIVSWKYE